MRLKINSLALEMAIRALGMTIKEACKRSKIDRSGFGKYRREGSMPISIMAKLNEGTGIDPVAYVPHFAKKNGG